MISDVDCGVYQIRNTVNDKCYIGSSVDIYRRWVTHIRDLKKSNHYNIHLQGAWNKYGQSAFVLETLELCPREQLHFIEQDFLDDFSPEYNFKMTADGGNGGNGMRGKHHSLETITRMSFVKIGKTSPNKGKHLSLETKEKMSLARLGKIPGNKGKLCSSKTRIKMSLAHLGKKRGPMSKEQKLKISLARLGSKRSLEARAKTSASLLATWKKRKEDVLQSQKMRAVKVDPGEPKK